MQWIEKIETNKGHCLVRGSYWPEVDEKIAKDRGEILMDMGEDFFFGMNMHARHTSILHSIRQNDYSPSQTCS